jgi:fatty acid desaturase
LAAAGSTEITNQKQMEDSMSIDRMVMAFAGGMILISILLSLIHSQYWLFLTAFVGANLFQAAFTGFCPLAIILKKLGMKPGMAFK